YASSEAWRAELNLFTKNIADDAMRLVVRNFVNGINPTETARRLRETIGTSSLAQSENLMRTIQLTSYRDSLTLYHTANADIFSHKIRIATLGERTCVSCIAQHGTRMRIDEEIKDHHRGRCSAVAVVRGMERNIQTGEVWFGQQSEASQKKIMGGAAYRAWKDDAVQLKDFVHPYENGVFGEMQREASLKGMLGAEANKYYRQKP
ncbi:MAG: phage head morphogenesis protein, partial [Anaerolineae bacterium]|nr:phage head morphogenesis protein [Anaerolineae bacterium]